VRTSRRQRLVPQMIDEDMELEKLYRYGGQVAGVAVAGS
jgi:hypothetical protein